MVDAFDQRLSIRRQCSLLAVNRSNLYYEPTPARDDTELANEIHELWLEMPFYGYRRVTAELHRRGYLVNRKRVFNLMRAMNLKALYPRPKTTIALPDHKIYPYLLRGLQIVSPNQVWSTDITYLRLSEGFVYLVALIDIYSRFVLSWRISNTLDKSFCLDMLTQSLMHGRPGILNTDQGCQFTSLDWIRTVEGHGIQVSMDGRGRWADNVFIERFWRTIKYEHVLLYSFDTVRQLKQSVGEFIEIYNTKRLHQSLGYKTPAEVYLGIDPKQVLTFGEIIS
jgi:putative transposase